MSETQFAPTSHKHAHLRLQRDVLLDDVEAEEAVVVALPKQLRRVAQQTQPPHRLPLAHALHLPRQRALHQLRGGSNYGGAGRLNGSLSRGDSAVSQSLRLTVCVSRSAASAGGAHLA